MATSNIPKSIQDIIRREAESASTAFVAGSAKSVDIPIPSVSGYRFLTVLNTRPMNNYGATWITINGSSSCRVWFLPQNSNTNTIKVDILYIKG